MSSRNPIKPKHISEIFGDVVRHVQDAFDLGQDKVNDVPVIPEPAIKLLSDAAETRGRVVLIWSDSDRLTDLIVTNIVRQLAINDGIVTLLAGQDNSNRLSLPAMILSALVPLPYDDLMSGRITDRGWDGVTTSLERVHNSPLYQSSGSISTLSDKVRRWRHDIPEGKLVIYRGTKIISADRNADLPASPFELIRNLVERFSLLSKAKDVSSIAVIENPFVGQLSVEQLMRATLGIGGSHIESCSVEPATASSIRITHASNRGVSESTFPVRWSCHRIDWDEEN